MRVGASTAGGGEEAPGGLAGRVEALEALLVNFSIVTYDDDDHSDIYITGANLHIENGEGSTSEINGFGNLIVGYNEGPSGGDDGEDFDEDPGEQPGNRIGSHNLVVGDGHTYTSFDGTIRPNSRSAASARG